MKILILDSRENIVTLRPVGDPDNPPPDSYDQFLYEPIPGVKYVPALKIRFNNGYLTFSLAVISLPRCANVKPVSQKFYPLAYAGITLAKNKFKAPLSQKCQRQVELRLKFWEDGGVTESADFVTTPKSSAKTKTKIPFALVCRYLAWQKERRPNWKDRAQEIEDMTGVKIGWGNLIKIHNRMFIEPHKKVLSQKN